MQFPDARILIFAKAPVPGRVKTRLIPALGEQGALDLYLDCLHHIIRQRCQAQIAPVIVYCTPDTTHPVLQQLGKRYPLTLRQQHGNDLGERMSAATQQCLAESDHIILTGVDAPSLTHTDIRTGLEQLQQQADVVMSPAEDGGYVMLGMKQHYPALFTDMPWGTGQIAQITRQTCTDQALKLVELPTRWDIDRPVDAQRFRC